MERRLQRPHKLQSEKEATAKAWSWKPADHAETEAEAVKPSLGCGRRNFTKARGPWTFFDAQLRL